jgi:carboxyl-terminal processing protease
MDFRKKNIKQLCFGVAIGAVLSVVSMCAYSGSDSDTKLPVKDVQKFTQSVDIIKNLYVDDVSDQELFESAIRGMLETLDPHSTYLDKKAYSDLNVSTTGEFGGLGIEVTMDHGVVKVVTPIDDTPAEKAGVEAGDLIVKIDGKSVRGMTISDAVSLMRGKKGTPIDLTIVRPGESKPVQIHIVRDIIKVDSVRSKVIDKYYGYIRISVFQSSTGANLAEAIDKLEKETNGDMKGLILDLRNNPGGVLQAAVAVSDTFLEAAELTEEAKIVYTKGRVQDSKFVGKAETPDRIKGIPIVVLVNSGSASASEIVAGALQDHGRAVIMGIKTFGKGSVQTVLPLKGDTAIKLTTARYYTPKGRTIQGEGITPDIIVEQVNVPYDEETINSKKEWRVREANLKNPIETKEDVDSTKDNADSNPVSPAEAEKNKLEPSQKEELSDEELVKEFAEAGEEAVKEKPIMYDDYQLGEALNVLKALVVVTNTGKKPK